MSAGLLDNNAITDPGFFGKVPAVGDFVSRRLPRDFIDPWDQWLQASIASSRQQLQDDWLDSYLNSPIWRFALSAGTAGALPTTGILMPSVDKAGRYFPFTLATLLPPGFNIFQVACATQQWYEAAETVALSVLEETPPDINALDGDVMALGPLADNAEAQTNAAPGLAGEDDLPWYFPIPAVTDMTDSMTLLVMQMMEQRCDAYSLWWTSGSEDIAPAMLMTHRLPPVSGYAAMIGGDWRAYGWSERAVMHSAIPQASETIIDSVP